MSEDKQVVRIKLTEKQYEWGSKFAEWVGTHLKGEIYFEDVEVDVKKISNDVQWIIQRQVREIIEAEVLSLLKRKIESEVATEVVQNLIKDFNIAEEVKKHMGRAIYEITVAKSKKLLMHDEGSGRIDSMYGRQRVRELCSTNTKDYDGV